MTTDAGGVLMGPFEQKLGGCVVEAAKFSPIPRVVAGFAALFCGMRIGMAAGASLIGEMVLASSGWRNSSGVSGVDVVHTRKRFVAITA